MIARRLGLLPNSPPEVRGKLLSRSPHSSLLLEEPSHEWLHSLQSDTSRLAFTMTEFVHAELRATSSKRYRRQ